MSNEYRSGTAASLPVAASRSARIGLTALLLAVIAIGLATLPEDLYQGDPVAMRISAAWLVEHGELGIPRGAMQRKTFRQLATARYFAENPETGRSFSKYGVMTTLLYAPAMWIEKSARGRLHIAKLKTRRLKLMLGVQQVLFASLIAYYLWRLARLHTRDDWLPVAFAAAILYGTFTWNYLRVQSSEIFQLAFFLGFIVHFTSWLRGDVARLGNLYAAQAWLALLILTKSVFVLLVPIIGVAAMWRCRAVDRPVLAGLWAGWSAHWRVLGRALVLPIAAVGVVLLLVNSYKFGSPLATGYSAAQGSLFGGDVASGLSGLLFSAQRSVFTHFPLLALSLFGLAAFARRFPLELGLYAAIFLVFLLAIAMFEDTVGDWEGGWGYGPRYLLFALPMASAPILCAFEGEGRSRLRRAALAASCAAVLGYSAFLQWNVNSLPFFTHHLVKRMFDGLESPHAEHFFSERHLGQVHRDLIRWRDRGEPLEPLEIARSLLPAARFDSLTEELRGRLTPNYFWLHGR